MKKSKYTLAGLVGIALLAGCSTTYAPFNPAADFPEAASCNPGSFDCWEDQDAVNEQGQTTIADFDPYGSSMTIIFSEPGSDLAGGTPGGAMRMFGNINKNAAPNWPWVSALMPFSGGPANWAALAPNGRIRFSYRAQGGSVLMGHEMRFYNPNNDGAPIGSGDWGHFGYQWTPTDTLWHEKVIYLPGKGSGPYTAPGGNEVALISWSTNPGWNAGGGSNITQIRFLALGNPVTARPYDMSIDDIIFE
jgi:hypothetical protein